MKQTASWTSVSRPPCSPRGSLGSHSFGTAVGLWDLQETMHNILQHLPAERQTSEPRMAGNMGLLKSLLSWFYHVALTCEPCELSSNPSIITYIVLPTISDINYQVFQLLKISQSLPPVQLDVVVRLLISATHQGSVHRLGRAAVRSPEAHSGRRS